MASPDFRPERDGKSTSKLVDRQSRNSTWLEHGRDLRRPVLRYLKAKLDDRSRQLSGRDQGDQYK